MLIVISDGLAQSDHIKRHFQGLLIFGICIFSWQLIFHDLTTIFYFHWQLFWLFYFGIVLANKYKLKIWLTKLYVSF